MVTSPRLTEEPKELHEDVNCEDEHHESDDSDTNSESSSNENALEVCSSNEPVGNFGNIVVKDSSDVHFGNKTFYHGPVTIKQFLYNNSSDTSACLENGHDNLALVKDGISSESVNNGATNLVTNGVKNGLQQFPDTTVSNEGINKCWPLIYKYKSIALSFVFFVTVIIILFITFLFTTRIPGSSFLNGGDSDEDESVAPVPLPRDPDAPPTLSGKLRIISRGQWVAQPPVHPANDLKTPVPYVIILHTATENCSDFGTCVFRTRYIQSFHIDSNGWWDIAYNFLVGGDGLAYEGRGWKKEGANAYGYNSIAIGIAFIGTFNDILPPPPQILAAKQLIEKGVEKGIIQKDYKLFAHRQLSSTQSPGNMLYEDMKKWPHWASSPDSTVINNTVQSIQTTTANGTIA